MIRPKSRPARWTEASGAAKLAIEGILQECDKLENAMSDLRSVQEEYEEWRDTAPESLQSSPTGEKLDQVADLEVDGVADLVADKVAELKKAFEALTEAFDALKDAAGEVEEKVGEADEADLPRGFGRD